MEEDEPLPSPEVRPLNQPRSNSGVSRPDRSAPRPDQAGQHRLDKASHPRRRQEPIKSKIDTPQLPQRFNEAKFASTYILHDIAQLDLEPRGAGFAAVICGHSHQPEIDYKDNVLYLNPGSIGPRRYKIPVALTLAACASDRWNTPLGSRVSANLIPLRSRPLLTGP